MDALLDVIGDDERHPVAEMLDDLLRCTRGLLGQRSSR
jgi:hypothetical protein